MKTVTVTFIALDNHIEVKTFACNSDALDAARAFCGTTQLKENSSGAIVGPRGAAIIKPKDMALHTDP